MMQPSAPKRDTNIFFTSEVSPRGRFWKFGLFEIGRASCRERVWITEVVGSSRRRHTRCGRDWSSDVCSSDLVDVVEQRLHQVLVLAERRQRYHFQGAVVGLDDAAVGTEAGHKHLLHFRGVASREVLEVRVVRDRKSVV